VWFWNWNWALPLTNGTDMIKACNLLGPSFLMPAMGVIVTAAQFCCMGWQYFDEAFCMVSGTWKRLIDMSWMSAWMKVWMSKWNACGHDI
jgi:hypothetical protein